MSNKTPKKSKNFKNNMIKKLLSILWYYITKSLNKLAEYFFKLLLIPIFSIRIIINFLTRLLSKLSAKSEVRGDSERRTGVYSHNTKTKYTNNSTYKNNTNHKNRKSHSPDSSSSGFSAGSTTKSFFANQIKPGNDDKQYNFAFFSKIDENLLRNIYSYLSSKELYYKLISLNKTMKKIAVLEICSRTDRDSIEYQKVIFSNPEQFLSSNNTYDNSLMAAINKAMLSPLSCTTHKILATNFFLMNQNKNKLKATSLLREIYSDDKTNPIAKFNDNLDSQYNKILFDFSNSAQKNNIINLIKDDLLNIDKKSPYSAFIRANIIVRMFIYAKEKIFNLLHEETLKENQPIINIITIIINLNKNLNESNWIALDEIITKVFEQRSYYPGNRQYKYDMVNLIATFANTSKNNNITTITKKILEKTGNHDIDYYTYTIKKLYFYLDNQYALNCIEQLITMLKQKPNNTSIRSTKEDILKCILDIIEVKKLDEKTSHIILKDIIDDYMTNTLLNLDEKAIHIKKSDIILKMTTIISPNLIGLEENKELYLKFWVAHLELSILSYENKKIIRDTIDKLIKNHQLPDNVENMITQIQTDLTLDNNSKSITKNSITYLPIISIYIKHLAPNHIACISNYLLLQLKNANMDTDAITSTLYNILEFLPIIPNEILDKVLDYITPLLDSNLDAVARASKKTLASFAFYIGEEHISHDTITYLIAYYDELDIEFYINTHKNDERLSILIDKIIARLTNNENIANKFVKNAILLLTDLVLAMEVKTEKAIKIIENIIIVNMKKSEMIFDVFLMPTLAKLLPYTSACENFHQISMTELTNSIDSKEKYTGNLKLYLDIINILTPVLLNDYDEYSRKEALDILSLIIILTNNKTNCAMIFAEIEKQISENKKTKSKTENINIEETLLHLIYTTTNKKLDIAEETNPVKKALTYANGRNAK